MLYEKLGAGNHECCGDKIRGGGDISRHLDVCRSELGRRLYAGSPPLGDDIGAEEAKHPLGVVPGQEGLCDGGLPLGIKAGQEHGGLYLGGGHRRIIVDAGERTAANRERGAAISRNASDGGAHLGERRHNPLHGPLLDGGIPGQGHVKVLGGENSGNQPHGGAAVSAVKHIGGLFKTPHALAVNQDLIPPIFNRNSHPFKAGNGGEAVCPLQKSRNPGSSLGKGPKHHGPVGDGFVSGHLYFSLKASGLCACNH